MTRFALLLAAVMTGAHVTNGMASAATKQPNLVLLLVDDLRWNTLGFMGDPVVQTPNLDRLASDGVVFRNAFVTTSICWQSRASIFTGQWTRRHGVMVSKTPLSDSQWAGTYPAALRAGGYRTGFIGKFGVGSAKDIEAKAAAFDYFRGLPGQAGESFFDEDDSQHTHRTAQFGNQALEFLAGCTAKKPFCLSISFNAVHARDGKPREYWPDDRDEHLYENTKIPVPVLATDEAYRRLPPLVQQSEGRRRYLWRFDTPEKTQSILRDYYRLITGIDREVGRIVAALEKAGQADNTVILFTSDNGYALGDRGMADKWYMYDEDIRVAMMVHDPRAKTSGRQEDAMTLNVDVAPTLVDLAGLPVPSVMQGRSLAPLLRGEKPADWRTDYFYEHHFSNPQRIPGVEGVRSERWSYMRWIDMQPVREELYDLAADPLEEHDLAGDPAHAKTLAELRDRWAQLQQQAK